MANVRATVVFCAVLLVVAALSSFTMVSAEDSSKSSEEHSSEKDASVPDDSSSQDDSKEKRSREEILFGNQQNKPSGLVDDLMSMTEEEAESTKDDEKKSNKSQEEQSEDATSKEDKRMSRPGGNPNDMMMGSGSDSWYNTEPASSSALQYLASAPSLQSLPTTDFSNSLYDQEDLYRRKRQLLGHPLPLRKRRSLRSSLGQMIQKRGIRMPRRSMRLKRHVDLLSLLGNDGYYDDQQQVSSPNFEGWEKRVEKKHVPGHFSAYPETPAPEFRIPFTFQHRDDGVLSLGNDFEDNKVDDFDPENMDDIDSLMLLHPNARYIETPEGTYYPYRTRDEEAEAFQTWLARHATPNIFTVSRRSSPTFYPMDYRYIPGYKKRSAIFRGKRMPSGFYGETEDTDSDISKWGHVVQVPDAYASAEDVARLYGLANLMAEGDDDDKMRRSV